MKPIIMVVGDHETYNLLQDSLSSHFQLIKPEHLPAIGEQVDLCVVDAPNLTSLGDWLLRKKAAEAPMIFPVLLVASHDNLSAMRPEQQRYIDGFIVTPFEPAELLSQVKTLLRTRELTYRLKLQAEHLASVGKAIESTSDAISISDTSGKAIYLNQAFTDLYGFRLSELNIRGIPNSLFVNPQVAEEIFRTIQHGNSWRGEVALKTRQGRIVPTLLRADTIEDDIGRRIGLISVHTDITARKRAEAIQRDQQAFENALRELIGYPD